MSLVVTSSLAQTLTMLATKLVLRLPSSDFWGEF